MVSSMSFKMRQLLIVLIMLLCISSNGGIMNTKDSLAVLNECLAKSDCNRISVDQKCFVKETLGDSECIVDISRLSQQKVTKLFNKLTLGTSAWLKCDGSILSEIDLSKVYIGHLVNELSGDKRLETHETFTIVNNVNLKRIMLPDMSNISPGFFTILNNPRLSRLSIDEINRKLVSESPTIIADSGETVITVRKLINENTHLQKYGECDYSSSGDTPLSWPQFRWCRVIPHDVTLDLSEFKSGSDPAYILNVTGRLTIKNTKITDLSMLPVYFRSKGGEISGNKDLCISFEDEIRMKRLDFQMENNKPLSCRTSCVIGEVTPETIKKLKDCVTLNGGLILNGIDADTAGADFFKTIRVINGPVVITNAKVTVDFKELKEIKLAGENSPHISLTNCTHPILFPNLTTLDGAGASHMVVLNNTRIDIFNYLNRTYLGKIKVLSRESMLNTITASGDIITSVSPSSNDKLTPGTVHVNRVVGQSTGAPGEQRDDRKPDTIKPHGTPEEKQVEPITAGSPVGDTDQGAAKNSSVIQRDPNNSAVEGKSNVLMVMTIVSLVVFLASSATSVGIIVKYSVL